MALASLVGLLAALSSDAVRQKLCPQPPIPSAAIPSSTIHKRAVGLGPWEPPETRSELKGPYIIPFSPENRLPSPFF